MSEGCRERKKRPPLLSHAHLISHTPCATQCTVKCSTVGHIRRQQGFALNCGDDIGNQVMLHHFLSPISCILPRRAHLFPTSSTKGLRSPDRCYGQMHPTKSIVHTFVAAVHTYTRTSRTTLSGVIFSIMCVSVFFHGVCYAFGNYYVYEIAHAHLTVKPSPELARVSDSRFEPGWRRGV